MNFIEKLSCASTVTRRTYAEYMICKISLEQYHNVEWFISCDSYAYKLLSNLNNVHLIQSISVDDTACIQSRNGKNALFHDITSHKIDGILAGIDKHGYCIFLDTDLVFTAPLEQRFFSLLTNENIDIIVSPHMTNSPHIESIVGYYNTGFFSISNINLAYKYKEICGKSIEYDLYYDQQPLQFACYDYIIAGLPINYNIGWWRFLSKSFNKETQYSKLMNNNDYESLCLEDNTIFYKNKPAIFFHTHMLKKYDTSDSGHFLTNKLFQLMEQSNNTDYHNITDRINKHFCL